MQVKFVCVDIRISYILHKYSWLFINMNMHLKNFENIRKFYFIGVGGISMSALAKFLAACGYSVAGSDKIGSAITENLPFFGVKTYIGGDVSRQEFLRSDCVVYTDAINAEDEELSKAKQMGKRVLSRAGLLKMVSENFAHTIAVAGSHGKTTCTSICAHALKAANVPFMAHIGGEDSTLGNYYFDGLDYLITEACEYKKNLLQLQPDVGILLNVDKDHMECYDGEEDLAKCFYEFCAASKTAFVCADEKRYAQFSRFASFGITNPLSDYRATELRACGERYSFTIEEYGRAVCRVKLNAIGYCNVYNALAAFAAMRSLGFDEKEIAKGIQAFSAVKRRFEKIGEYHGVSFICDYAHHPKEILSTVATAKRICKGELYVVFQPHTYSRTKLLAKEFADSLGQIENLLIYKTYPAREKYDEEGSAEHLSTAIGNCLYLDNVYTLKTWIKQTVKERDILLFLGAGDIYYVAQYVLGKLI